MKIRPGCPNGRNLYLQLGDEPADSDPCLGFIIDPAVARLLAARITGDEAAMIRDWLVTDTVVLCPWGVDHEGERCPACAP